MITIKFKFVTKRMKRHGKERNNNNNNNNNVFINLGFYAQRWTRLTITFVTFLLHTKKE